MSDTAIASPKQKIIDNASKAASGKPVCDPKSPCQPCQRADLQLLIVLPSVVPTDHKAALGDAGYAWAPSFDPGFVLIKREATIPIARVMREGYVYLYYLHRKRWDVWQVMENGLTRKIMNQVDKKEYERLQAGFAGGPVPKSCSRGSANVPAHLISVQGAKTTPKAWLAFSSHLWSGYVLQRFADNPQVDVPGMTGTSVKKDLRALRGREINPQKIISDGMSHSALPLNQAALEHSVADFVRSASPEYKRAFDVTLTPLNEGRFGMAADFVEAVRKLERASAPPAAPELYLNKSIILMLPDPLGVAEQHNHLRLVEKEAKSAWMIGANGVQQAPDLERVWKLRSSMHIDMIEQWEAATDAKRITDEVSNKMHANRPPITEEDFSRQMKSGRLPAGTRWEPDYLREKSAPFSRELGDFVLDEKGQKQPHTVKSQYVPGETTRLGRITLPSDVVKKEAEKFGTKEAAGFRSRLRSRLDFSALDAFRKEYNAESERWDKRIERFDRDHLGWREGTDCISATLHDFSHNINLRQFNPKFGSMDQQVDDLFARVISLEKTSGGGAIGPDSAKALASLYKRNPSDPLHWIDSAMYAPFNFEKEVYDDPGNKTEASEGLAGMYDFAASLAEVYKRNKSRHVYERAAASIIATRVQLTNLVASAMDRKTAKNLAMIPVTETQALKFFKLHVAVELLHESLLYRTPQQRSTEKFVINIKIPTGVGADLLREGMTTRVVPAEYTDKTKTSKHQRQFTQKQFEKLKTKLKGRMDYPVLLDRQMIAKMITANPTGNMVEVVPDATLGLSSGKFKIPAALADELIREQSFHAKDIIGGGSVLLGGIGCVQVLALWDAAKKMQTEKGIAQEDGLLSTMSSVMGLLETVSSSVLHVWSVRTDGMRSMRVSSAATMAGWRLAAARFGAAASVIDGALAFVKAGQAERSGDKKTAFVFNVAGTFYLASAALNVASALAIFQSQMGSGLIVEWFGVRGAMALGNWLAGVGLVLSLIAFGTMLYAIHTAYQMTDYFLDRSYWGLGEHETFGRISRTEIGRIRNNRALNEHSRNREVITLVNNGVTAEVEAFLGLTIGAKVEFEWHRNMFSNEEVTFKLEALTWPFTQMLSLRIELFAPGRSIGLVVLDEKELILGDEKNSNGFLSIEKSWVFKNGSHTKYTYARAFFKVEDVAPGGIELILRDTLIAKREA